MRYLKKQNNSYVVTQNLTYAVKSNRNNIREILLTEQKRYCAYSERYIKNTDS